MNLSPICRYSISNISGNPSQWNSHLAASAGTRGLRSLGLQNSPAERGEVVTQWLPPPNATGNLYLNIFSSLSPFLSFPTSLRPQLLCVSNTPGPLLCPCARENRLVGVYNFVKLLGELTMPILLHSGHGSVLR